VDQGLIVASVVGGSAEAWSESRHHKASWAVQNLPFNSIHTYHPFPKFPNSLPNPSYTLYIAPNSFNFEIIPSTSSTFPPPFLGGGSMTLTVWSLFFPASTP
jgi:hypothetical protein